MKYLKKLYALILVCAGFFFISAMVNINHSNSEKSEQNITNRIGITPCQEYVNAIVTYEGRGGPGSNYYLYDITAFLSDQPSSTLNPNGQPLSTDLDINGTGININPPGSSSLTVTLPSGQVQANFTAPAEHKLHNFTIDSIDPQVSGLCIGTVTSP